MQVNYITFFQVYQQQLGVGAWVYARNHYKAENKERWEDIKKHRQEVIDEARAEARLEAKKAIDNHMKQSNNSGVSSKSTGENKEEFDYSLLMYK